MHKLIFINSCFYEPNVDAVVERLSKRNISWFRFNTETFPLIAKLCLHSSDSEGAYATVTIENNRLDTREITAAWYRNFGSFVLPEGLSKREQDFTQNETLAALSAMYICINCFSVNPRAEEHTASKKVYQLSVAHQIGIATPRTIITNDASSVREFLASCSDRVIFKPVAGLAASAGPPKFLKEMQDVYPRKFSLPPSLPENEDKEHVTVYAQLLTPDKMQSLEAISGCPVTFQEYIEKDVELRITIVGDDIFAAEIHSQELEHTNIDFRRMASGAGIPTHKIHKLPEEVSTKLMLLMKRLGMVFGCVDMILTPEGEYVFLEVNTAGQWGWVESLTGMPITDALTDMLIRGSAGTGS